MDKTACENMDPTTIYHFIASIDNTAIADKIVRQVQDASIMLHKCITYTLILETDLQLADGIHLGRPPQLMLVSTDG